MFPDNQEVAKPGGHGLNGYLTLTDGGPQKPPPGLLNRVKLQKKIKNKSVLTTIFMFVLQSLYRNRPLFCPLWPYCSVHSSLYAEHRP